MSPTSSILSLVSYRAFKLLKLGVFGVLSLGVCECGLEGMQN